MERSILAFMMKLIKIIKNSFILIILFLLILYKGVFINLVSNITSSFKNNEDPHIAQINILNEKIKHLENEYKTITNIEPYAEYNYTLTRLSYLASYDASRFFIRGGLNLDFKENYILLNSLGVVGVINKVYKDYSEATFLTDVSSLSVRINDAYGTLSGYENGLFILNDLSNYDNVSLNDEVYTSSLGIIKENLFIGTVYKIEKTNYKKKIYVKSKVDFKDINYLYVVGS